MDSPTDSTSPATNYPPAGTTPPPWIAPPANTQTEGNQPPAKPEPVLETASPAAAGLVRKSPFAKLVPLLFLLLLGVGLFFLITKVVLPLVQKTREEKSGVSAPGKEVNLTYWGLWEAETMMVPLIEAYQQEHPQVKIKYVQQSHRDYRERLQSALARNEGPDIFRFHNSWLPMLKKELAPAPANIAQTINLAADFYPVISQDLQIGSQIFGVPLGFDNLALFYNPQILKEGGKTFPTSWEELRRTALDLCVAETKDKICHPGEKILTAGVALGTANNVDHFSDILGLMMLQNGVDLTKPSGALAEDALKFYTFFTTVDGVWNNNFPASTYAFATGKVAMIFAPSWRAYEIKQINPQLEFKTASVPQLPGTEIAWATYWVEGVSNKSANNQAAWEFLEYLSSQEGLVALYNQASKTRNFGEPYPRKSLASQLESDPVVGSFVKQGNYSQSWYLCSSTHDNGINDKMIKYFEDAVNSVLGGESVSQVLEPLNQGVVQVLSQYNIQ
jgi:multiple sugar transport system substrate-binding protein